MNIGQAAKQTGLPPKTIRYYEDIGLVTAPRHGNGYRYYADQHLDQLSFVGRARNLGFSVEECRELLKLYNNTGRTNADVKAIVQHHLEDIDGKLRALKAMRKTLLELESACPGDQGSDCPVLKNLAGNQKVLR